MTQEDIELGVLRFSQGSTIEEVRELWHCGRNKAIKVLKVKLGDEQYAEIAKRTRISRFTSAAARANLGSTRGPMSAETKEKISKGNSGKKRSESAKWKISQSLRERVNKHGPLRTAESYQRGGALARETKIKNGTYKSFSEKMRGRKRSSHTETTKEKMSLSRKRFYLRGGQNWNLGKRHSEKSISLMSLSTKRMWENGAFDSGNGLWRSKLEIRVFEEISSYYTCKHSYRIERRVYDIFVEDLNLLIEVNGDYWHLNPLIYPADYYDKHRSLNAAEIWERDSMKLELAKSHGYNIEVLWQNDLRSDFYGAIKNVISRYEGGDHQREASAST